VATRAQIFVGAEASLYVHFDGYPDGVMPTIVPALEHYRRQGEFWEPERVLAFITGALTIQAEIRRQASLINTRGRSVQEIFKAPRVPRHYLVPGKEVVPGVEYVYIVRYDPSRDSKPKVRVFEVGAHPIREGTTLVEVMAYSTPIAWKPLGEAAVWMTAMRSYYRGVDWGRVVKRIAKVLSPKVLPKAS
jgi:hypothetical protein